LKKNRLTLHRRIWHCHFLFIMPECPEQRPQGIINSSSVFWCDFYFRDAAFLLLCSWCIWSLVSSALVLLLSMWPAPTWGVHHGEGDHESDRQGHFPPTGPEEDFKGPPTADRQAGDMWSLKDDKIAPNDPERNWYSFNVYPNPGCCLKSKQKKNWGRRRFW
jgi:hypothetical protein